MTHCFNQPLVKASVKGLVVDKSVLPGGDNFIRNFDTTYLTNANVHNSLLVRLMQAYISKINGHNNRVYETAVTNFYLSLAGTGSKQAIEFVSTNLRKSVSICHLQRIQTKKRTVSLIVQSSDDVIGIVLKQFDV
jgi:hypothetical protein